MNTYALISADLAARLGLKRLTIGILITSVATNVLLASSLLFKKDTVTTVLVPVGVNETTHPLTVGERHVDQDYLMLVARDLLSLAMNVTPETLTVEASGTKRHFIGKTETMRQSSTVTMRFTLVAGKLQLSELTEASDEKSRR